MIDDPFENLVKQFFGGGRGLEDNFKGGEKVPQKSNQVFSDRNVFFVFELEITFIWTRQTFESQQQMSRNMNINHVHILKMGEGRSKQNGFGVTITI